MFSRKPCRHEIYPLPHVRLGCSGVCRTYVSSSFSRLGTKAPLAEASTISISLCATVLISPPITGSLVCGFSDPPGAKNNSWSIRAIQVKMDGSLWQAGLLPFFATLEWHSCSHLILFCHGTASITHYVGSFSPVPHPLLRSCTSQIQASRPSTFVRIILTEICS